jgi:DNA-binding NtrC family response regulator
LVVGRNIDRETERLCDSGPKQRIARRWRIGVVDGPDAGRSLVREGGTILVGSEPSADLSISDPAVSRRHVKLELLAEGVLAIDLSSKNGTRVSGVLIDRALIRPGGELRVGRTRIRIDPDEAPLEAAQADFSSFLTAHAPLRRAITRLRVVAKSDATLLFQGEPGVGKRHLAHLVHAASPRAREPLVIADFASLVGAPIEQIDAQLFGEAMSVARGGTLLLVEISKLPLELQPKLLRLLDAENECPRCIATSSAPLDALVEALKFRADLYYRIAVIETRVPPLRDRPEDIGLIARALIGDHRELSEEALALLAQDAWPNNVSDLREVVARAADASASTIQPEHVLRPTAMRSNGFHHAKDEVIAAFERRYLAGLLARHRDNLSAAAREAGLSRNALYALMRRAGMVDR